MIKKMLVNATHPEENRVAIVADGILSELDIEIEGREQTKGNIYKAVVVRVETGLQAAFVDYGAERLGFLQLGEIHPKYNQTREGQESKARPRIGEILHRGQELLVQIVKEERGNKGAALTTFLSLPGRYMVLMPDDDTRGVSRKIPDGKDRKQLKQVVDALELPAGTGYIIRTAAIGQTQTELQRDLDYLLRLFENIKELSGKFRAPALVYQESNLVIRSLRDYFTPDMDEILVDDPQVFDQARTFIQQVMPEHAKLLKLHQERRPIFSKYQIEEQIETISRNQILLPSGGSIVIDTTEALVAIDVNSGKMATEQGVEGTAFKTNLEAASEAARQLRLRDLGGLVVIDFIDMRDRKHIRAVEKQLQEALKADKARVTVGRISQFGLLEMSRQRIKAALAAGAYKPCPHCEGSGRVKSTEAQAISVLRKIHAGIAKGNIERVIGDIPLEVAEYLLNTKRDELHDMERRYQASIYLRGRSELRANQDDLIFQKREKEEKRGEDVTQPATASAAIAESQRQERPHKPAVEEEIVPTEEPLPQPHPQAKTKRSRSRRRKGADAKPAETDQPLTDDGGELPPSPEIKEPPAANTLTESPSPSTEETPTAAAETPAAEAPKLSRSAKRRARRKKSTAKADPHSPADGMPAPEDVTVTTPAQDEPLTAEPPAEGAPVVASESAAKRRTRRGGTRKKATAAKGGDQPTGQEGQAPVQQAPPALQADTSPDTEPKPAAEGRVSVKPEQEGDKTVPKQAEEKVEAATEPKKPAAKRRTRKKAEKPQAEDPVSPPERQTAVEPEKESPAPKAPEPEPATARKRPTRKVKNAPDKLEQPTAETSGTAQAPATDEPNEAPKKPARKPAARKRTTTKKAAATPETES